MEHRQVRKRLGLNNLWGHSASLNILGTFPAQDPHAGLLQFQMKQEAIDSILHPERLDGKIG
jgi:hypothetical protein